MVLGSQPDMDLRDRVQIVIYTYEHGLLEPSRASSGSADGPRWTARADRYLLHTKDKVPTYRPESLFGALSLL